MYGRHNEHEPFSKNTIKCHFYERQNVKYSFLKYLFYEIYNILFTIDNGKARSKTFYEKHITKYAFLKDIIERHIRKCPFSKKQSG